jgi:hypothetical protein
MKLGTLLVGSLVVLGTACAVVPDEAGKQMRGGAEDVNNAEHLGRSELDVSTSFFSMTHPGHDAGTGASGAPCGTSLCKDGEFCCNESCGICAPRGGVCTQRECGTSPVPLAQCLVNADCRAFSSYCDGCQCLPTGVLDPDPSCHATIVACFMNPCHHKQAACINGLCQLIDH